MANPETALMALGFRFGINGPHAARTMMLDELRLLLAYSESDASRADYAAAIVEHNVLGKPTRKARDLTLRHLLTLYGLDAANPLFRVLRRLWKGNESAQPILALGVALARDPLLRATRQFILGQPIGGIVPRDAMEGFLAQVFPERFSPASLKSFAQNISGTWTAGGLLCGRQKKVRSQPQAHPESVTMLLFLGYLAGRNGQRLFSSEWTSILGIGDAELESLASSASHRGLLVFLNAGGVKEVRFPGYLTPDEERIRQELTHVV
jgi:hypothetical protein